MNKHSLEKVEIDILKDIQKTMIHHQESLAVSKTSIRALGESRHSFVGTILKRLGIKEEIGVKTPIDVDLEGGTLNIGISQPMNGIIVPEGARLNKKK